MLAHVGTRVAYIYASLTLHNLKENTMTTNTNTMFNSTVDLTMDTQRITLETTRAYKMVMVHTLWLDGKASQDYMQMDAALRYQLTNITQCKAITIWQET